MGVKIENRSLHPVRIKILLLSHIQIRESTSVFLIEYQIMRMLKKIIKKTFLYSLYKKNLQRLYHNEIKKRLANDTLLKDYKGEELDTWNERIALVLASADNQKIKYVEDAGTFKGKWLVMHNGIIIDPLSYYGFAMLKILRDNRGIHEPQEEYVFQEVLKDIPEGATMIELGAYWSFYSMWFNKEVKNAKNYMIEPWNIDSGRMNFELNKLEGKFFQSALLMIIMFLRMV